MLNKFVTIYYVELVLIIYNFLDLLRVFYITLYNCHNSNSVIEPVLAIYNWFSYLLFYIIHYNCHHSNSTNVFWGQRRAGTDREFFAGKLLLFTPSARNFQPRKFTRSTNSAPDTRFVYKLHFIWISYPKKNNSCPNKLESLNKYLFVRHALLKHKDLSIKDSVQKNT